MTCLFFLYHGSFSISKKGAIFAEIWSDKPERICK